MCIVLVVVEAIVVVVVVVGLFHLKILSTSTFIMIKDKCFFVFVFLSFLTSSGLYCSLCTFI